MAKDIDRTKRLKWDPQKIIRLVAALAFPLWSSTWSQFLFFMVREWNIFSIFIYFVLLFSVFGQMTFPFLSYVRAYPVYLLASIFGLWMALLFWLNRFGALQHPLSFSIALVVSLGILYPSILLLGKARVHDLVCDAYEIKETNLVRE